MMENVFGRLIRVMLLFGVAWVAAACSSSPPPARTSPPAEVVVVKEPETLPPLPVEKMKRPKPLNVALLKKLTTSKPPEYNDPIIARAFAAGEVYTIPTTCAIRRGSPMLNRRGFRHSYRLSCLEGILPFLLTYEASLPEMAKRGPVLSARDLLARTDQGPVSGLIQVGTVESINVYFRFLRLD